MSEENQHKPPSGLASFWSELKRRKVMRVAITYAAVAWLIIQIAATTFEGFGIPLWAFRFVTIMLVIGAPVAIIIAWAFELTPEGIKTTRAADEARGDKPVSKQQQQKRNWMAYAIGAAVPTLIFGVLAGFFYLRSDPPVTPKQSVGGSPSQVEVLDKSIAVLPLVNMSPDAENAFFADGVQEEILTNLSQIKELFVMGRTSTLRYRDSVKSLKEIGSELGVKYLLEGSVQRAANQVRVTVQLIESETEGHLWAESYTHELDDFFVIISSISKEIAGQLHTVLSPAELSDIERPPTENKEAYDYYLRARQLGMVAAMPLLEKAVALDPNFYEAWFRLALNRIISWRRYKNRNDPELYEAAYKAFNETERLAPGTGFQLALKGVFVYNENGDLQTALEYELKANALEPGSYNIPWRSFQLGRLAEAQVGLEAQIKMNPFSRTIESRLFNLYLCRGLWENAKQVIHNTMEDYSGDPKRELEGQRNLVIVDYLETADKQAFSSSNVALPVIVDPQYVFGWMNDNYKIRDALIVRNFTDALDYLKDPDPYPAFTMLEGTLAKGVSGRWRLTIEPLNLLAALIHFEREERVKWMSEMEKAKDYLEKVIKSDDFADPDYSSLLAICYALEGDQKRVEALIPEVREKTSNINQQFRFQARCEVHFAICYLILGDHDKAIEILEGASKLHSPLFLNRELDLWFIFDRLKGNPRFDALLED